jgi:hypothetical protein
MNDLILIFKLYLHSIIYYIDQILKAIIKQCSWSWNFHVLFQGCSAKLKQICYADVNLSLVTDTPLCYGAKKCDLCRNVMVTTSTHELRRNNYIFRPAVKKNVYAITLFLPEPNWLPQCFSQFYQIFFGTNILLIKFVFGLFDPDSLQWCIIWLCFTTRVSASFIKFSSVPTFFNNWTNFYKVLQDNLRNRCTNVLIPVPSWSLVLLPR